MEGLFENSFQGDAELVNLGSHLGIQSNWDNAVLTLEKADKGELFSYDFINQPDIAQTVGVICAANGIKNEFSGLQTLRIKETDRIDAMDRELKKIGSYFRPLSEQTSASEQFHVGLGLRFSDKLPRFDTYKDHRMAMSLAPIALRHPIEINQPGVVSKSYPAFWEDLMSLGFEIQEVD